MSDISLLVSEIRAFLQRDDQTLNDRLTDLARQYADECATVNSRLAMCSRLLSQGLRSEAIQQSEADPNLLDQVTSLDFPDRSEWEAITEMYGLSRPPGLLMAIASELNQAYAEENPLRDLLKQHRRLALMRAPLAKRTAILAQIAAQDITNPVWNIDLASYQKVRLAEIKEEATVAVKAGDLLAVKQLQNEVIYGYWIDQPSPALIKGLEQANSVLTRNEARAMLPELEAGLQNAVVLSHIEEAKRLGTQWRETISLAALAANDPISQRMLPALEWIALQNKREEQSKEFESEVAVLDEALTDDAPLEYLLELVSKLSKYEREVPSAIVVRYEARLERQATLDRLVRYGTWSTWAALVLLIAGWTGYSIWHGRRTTAADRQSKIIDQALVNNDLDSARTLIENLKKTDPGLLTYSVLDRSWTRFDEARAKDDKRITDLKALIAGISQELTLPWVVVELAKARSLVRTAEERAELAALEQKREQLLVKAQTDIDLAILPQLEALARGLNVAEDHLKGENAASASSEVAALAEQFRVLRTRLSTAGPLSKTKGNDILRRLTVAQQATNKAVERQLAQAELSKSVAELPRQVEGYVSALNRYRLTLPPGAIMSEADHSLAERPVWSSALTEVRVMADWLTAARMKLSPAEAQKRTAELKEYEKQLVSAPDHKALTRYQEYLATVARRLGPGGIPQIERLAADPLISRARLIHIENTPNKERYYTIDPIDSRTTKFHYFTDYNTDKTQIKSATLGGMDKHDLAPQVVIGKALRSALPVLKDGSGSWEGTILELLDQVRSQPDLDPILRIDLLDGLMQIGSNGSAVLSELFMAHRDYRKSIKIRRGLRWMNPDDLSASEDRPKAEELGIHFPAFAPLVEPALEKVEPLELPGLMIPRVIGWLQHGEGGILCQTVNTISEPGGLYVVAPAEDAGSQWVRVGEWVDGASKLDLRNPAALQEGRLVFFRPDGLK